MIRLCLPAALLAFATLAAAEPASQFRGPAGTGDVPDATFPLEWAKGKNVAWKVDVPGVGWSSPAVVGNRVFLTTATSPKQPKAKGMTEGVKDLRSMIPGIGKAPTDEYAWEVICLDRSTGKTLWRKEASKQKPPIPSHPSNTYATESPVADVYGVYAVMGPIGVVVAYDNDGKERWRKQLDVGPMTAGFGTGGSPALADGRLFVQRDNEKKSSLTAFDTKSGKELWKVDRDVKTSWSTPLVWRNKVRTELVVCGTGCVISHDPETGKVLWTLKGIPATFTASPTADSDRVYFGTSSPTTTGSLYAVTAGASGDITPAKGETTSKGVAWSASAQGPGMQSPVVRDGKLYLSGNGFLRCLDAKTGEVVYRSRLPQTRMGAASLLTAQGRLWILDEDGKMLSIGTGKKYELLGTNAVDGLFWSTPTAAGDSLFLRGADCLYCIRK